MLIQQHPSDQENRTGVQAKMTKTTGVVNTLTTSIDMLHKHLTIIKWQNTFKTFVCGIKSVFLYFIQHSDILTF